MNKKLLLFTSLLVSIGLAVWLIASKVEPEDSHVEVVKIPSVDDTHLPWQIDSDNSQLTRVFSVQVGEDSLSILVDKLKKVPELAVFEDADGSRQVEAYFSRIKSGVLQGGLAVELDVEKMDLAAFARFEKGGKPMPSGKRKFVLSKTGIINANKSRVWKLAYLPATNYSAAQIVRFFGEPESKRKLSVGIENQIENWIYPAKGLVITYDKEGREIFYYSARAEFSKLVKSINTGIKGKQDG